MIFTNNVQRGIIEYDKLGLNYWSMQKNLSTTMKNHLQQLNNNIDHDDYAKIHSNNKYISVDEAVNNGNKNFIISRHPYDRLLSIYVYLKNDLSISRKGHYLKVKKEVDNFNEFLHYLINHKLVSKASYLMFLRQYDYIDIHHFIKYIIVDCNSMHSSWPFEFEKPKKHLNIASENKPIITQEDKELIYEMYTMDFSFFGYEK